MRIFLVDVQPDRFAIRAVLANDSYECRNLIMQEYNEYKAKPSIRIYASYANDSNPSPATARQQ